MVNYPTKSLLSFLIPSVFGVITILWFFKRKPCDSNQKEKTKTLLQEQDQYLSKSYSTNFMKLKNSEGSSSCQSNSEMQLKEIESSSVKQASEMNGVSKTKKSKKMKGSKVCGNGITCSVKATNGNSKDNTFSSEEDENLANGLSLINLNSTTTANVCNVVESANMMGDGNEIKSNGIHKNPSSKMKNGFTEKAISSSSHDSCETAEYFVVENICDKDSERHSVCSDCSSGVSDCSTNSILDANIDRECSPTICEVSAQSPHYDSGLETNGHTISSLHSQVNFDGYSSPDSVANEIHMSNIVEFESSYHTDDVVSLQTSLLSKDSNKNCVENEDNVTLTSDSSCSNIQNITSKDKTNVPLADNIAEEQLTSEIADNESLSPVAFNIDAESFIPSLAQIEDNNFESIASEAVPIEEQLLDYSQPIDQTACIGFVPVEFALPVPMIGALNEDRSLAFQTMAEKEWEQIFINYAAANLKFFPNAATAEGDADIYGILAPCEDEEMFDVYEFEIQPEYCGRLIGKAGKNVKMIHDQAGAQILILPHPFLEDMKLCSVHGTSTQIFTALKLIRDKIFPLARFPEVSLAQLNNLSPSVESLQLPLPESVTVDVCLTCTVNPGHIFIQQPTHSTFHQLAPLSNYMTQNYSTYSAPMLGNAAKGNVCAVFLETGWYRAEVNDVFDDGQVRVKFLDYGGYATVPHAVLRKIRYEFAQIPFQATECFLANIAPAGEGWTAEALAYFESMLQDKLLQCQVVGYSENKIPLIHLFVTIDSTTVFVNNALVEAGFAQFIPTAE